MHRNAPGGAFLDVLIIPCTNDHILCACVSCSVFNSQTIIIGYNCVSFVWCLFHLKLQQVSEMNLSKYTPFGLRLVHLLGNLKNAKIVTIKVGTPSTQITYSS